MSVIRANQMQSGELYVMKVFRRNKESRYQSRLVRFVHRTSSTKLVDLSPSDYYVVIDKDGEVKLVPDKGVLGIVLNNRFFRVTFSELDDASSLGVKEDPSDIPDEVIKELPVEPVEKPEPVEPVTPVEDGHES